MSTTLPPPAISVLNLVKTYEQGGPRAVDDITFTVEPGSIFGLLGPNGAGKTTTIKMILGLVTPTQGKVFLAGYDVTRQRNQALRRVGAVLEGSRNIYWRLSARGNLEYFAGLRGMRGQELRQRIDEVLHLLELSDRDNEETRRFSRGMQQKVALGVAMLHDPDVLLLDEPTLGLDVQAARTMKETVQKLARQHGKAVLLTTHQMNLAEELCDRILVIDKGRRVAEGPTREVIAQFGEPESVVEIHLGCNLADELWAALTSRFPNARYSAIEGDNSILSLPVSVTQRQVIELLAELDNYGIPILSVGRRAQTLEETFIRLTKKENSR
jgi:ABC-2 type transport system ATP-binding protein